MGEANSSVSTTVRHAGLATAAARARDHMAVRLPPFYVAAGWLVFGLVNGWFAGWAIVEILKAGFAQTDWNILVTATASGDPYRDTLYRWSPLLLGPLSVLVHLGFATWAGMHVAAVLVLPTWRLRGLTLISWPFIQDVSNGNVMTFVVVLAIYAVQGSRWAGVAFLIATAVMPRPLMLPVAVFVLLQRPGLRAPFLGLLVASVASAAVLEPGWFEQLAASGGDLANPYNIGPSHWLGWVWVPLGLVLSWFLAMSGRLGWASLAASPYWLPYYLLFALLPDVRPLGRRQEAGEPAQPA